MRTDNSRVARYPAQKINNDYETRVFHWAFTQSAEEKPAEERLRLFDRIALSLHAGTKGSLEILEPGFLCL